MNKTIIIPTVSEVQKPFRDYQEITLGKRKRHVDYSVRCIVRILEDRLTHFTAKSRELLSGMDGVISVKNSVKRFWDQTEKLWILFSLTIEHLGVVVKSSVIIGEPTVPRKVL